jgi:PAS domain S-box-containing protein
MAGGAVKARSPAEDSWVQGIHRNLAAGIRCLDKWLELGKRARHLIEFLGVGVAYFVLAEIGLALASSDPVASPIWPPTGFALAMVVLRGYRIWPAIFLAALIANEMTTGLVYTSLAIAVGNTMEAIIGGYLINHWCGGRRAFETPAAITRFALCVLSSTAVSATIGVASLCLAGYALWSNFVFLWATWWWADIASALVITPVLILWWNTRHARPDRRGTVEVGLAFLAAAAVGVLAFSPPIGPEVNRGPLAFLAVLPLLWTALRRNQRDTATVALILTFFAIWGSLAGTGPFARPEVEGSFLLLMFMISLSLPSLVLSADVAVRKLTEAALGSREEQFRALADAMPQLAWMAHRDGSVFWFNRRWYEYTGLAQQQALGGGWHSVHDPNELPQVLERWRLAMAAGEPLEIVFPLKGADGIFRPFLTRVVPVRDVAGRIEHWFGTNTDITAEREAEGALHRLNEVLEQRIAERTAALTESDRRFRLLVEGVTDYAIFMLDPEGIVANWNAGAERIGGYAAEEIVGQHFSCFYTQEDRQNSVPTRTLASARSSGKHEAEGWRVRKDGSRFWASVVIDAIHEEDGRLVGFAMITRDMTERRAVEEQLHQAQKMEVVGQLSGGIAHDFSNLLGIIMMNLETIERRLRSEDKKLRRPIEMALEGGRRAAALTDRLLAFSRRRPLASQTIEMNKLVSGMSDLLHRTLGEQVSIETALSPGLWRTAADVNQLESALLNLAVNARDAMPEGGKLTIETANVYLDESYTEAQADLKPGRYVMVAVRDTGVGMTKEVAARAFEPFFTTKDVGRGTGLGLSQVYGFAKQSRGHVKIDSAPGAGTTVKLYLPRGSGDRAVRVPEEEMRTVPGGSSETILLVEDEIDLRVSTAESLRELGYRVLEAGDGPTALSLLDGKPEIDLLFTDIGLPGGLNGRQLTDEARRRRPGLKVLFSTGYARNAVLRQGRAVPDAEVIVKPLTYSALATKIRRMLEGN